MVTFRGDLGAGCCLSGDTKPTTGVPNGAKLAEMDTGNVYRYDAENQTWEAWTGTAAVDRLSFFAGGIRYGYGMVKRDNG